MAEFEKPKVDYAYDVVTERKALQELKVKRGIPEKTPNTLLIATWNLANFGAQDRRDDDIKLMAEILSWFDLIAVQEVRENKTDFEKLNGQEMLRGRSMRTSQMSSYSATLIYRT